MTHTVPQQEAKNARSWAAGIRCFFFFLALSAITLLIGGWLTSLGMGEWYDELRKPSWQPPGWVFSPVWTTLMVLLALATSMVYIQGRGRRITAVALIFYALQLALNMTWSALFFTFHLPSLALVEIFVLDVVLLGMIVSYSRISLLASALIVPYALWLGLATSLNIWIVVNN